MHRCCPEFGLYRLWIALGLILSLWATWPGSAAGAGAPDVAEASGFGGSIQAGPGGSVPGFEIVPPKRDASATPGSRPPETGGSRAPDAKPGVAEPSRFGAADYGVSPTASRSQSPAAKPAYPGQARSPTG